MDIKERIVREEFGAMCNAYRLRIEKIGDGEFVLIGSVALLLIWLAPEGVTVKYVRPSASSGFEALDLGRFIALKRGWVTADSLEADEENESRLRRECSSYAVNLQKYGGDILKGETDWMKDISGSHTLLSEITGKAIKSAITRNENFRAI